MSRLLNVVVTGDVDAGKSTLVGRLLFDTGSLREGAVEDVERYCRRWGRAFEYAWLLDSFEEERAGDFTLRATQAVIKAGDREYVFIDVPGHQELVVDMLSGASYAEAAVLVIDITRPVAEQSRRHAFLLQFLGLTRVVVALNKTDLADPDGDRLQRAEAEIRTCLAEVGLTPSAVIPVSAREGFGLCATSPRHTPEAGPTLLEAVGAANEPPPDQSLRFIAQDVLTLGGQPLTVGAMVAGQVRVGDEVTALPQGQPCRVARIRDGMTDTREAAAPRGIALGFEGNVAPRGTVVAGATLPEVLEEIPVRLFFVRPTLLDQRFLVRCATQERHAHLSKVGGVWDCATLAPRAEAREAQPGDGVDALLLVDLPLAVDRRQPRSAIGRVALLADGAICAIGMVS